MLKIFVRIGWTSYFVLKERKRGVFRQNLALWPPRSIVGVGDKHAHDSDHAECHQVGRHGLWPSLCGTRGVSPSLNVTLLTAHTDYSPEPDIIDATEWLPDLIMGHLDPRDPSSEWSIPICWPIFDPWPTDPLSVLIATTPVGSPQCSGWGPRTRKCEREVRQRSPGRAKPRCGAWLRLHKHKLNYIVKFVLIKIRLLQWHVGAYHSF